MTVATPEHAPFALAGFLRTAAQLDAGFQLVRPGDRSGVSLRTTRVRLRV
ncbi:hypothetical protein SAMN05192563_1004384 [Paraburkholderia aspalathi]|uniref:Uncharacterized protein n=1 Tax=Paraburkholderia aspalathi TaxID=1324617 RepID=A0A1I7BDY9_9BURK|nr:hypothetical protein SAMN05192563_1004384 [Paraburkholderia aspalathi]